MPEQQPLAAGQLELERLLDLTAKVGKDPLLTQASTGNISIKLDGDLWIKASGKWMANALRDDILIPLKLREVTNCLRSNLDPAERFANASLETAMHAVIPHRVVLHVHSVNTIAWAVRKDAISQLRSRLEGLRWQWIPYVASGMPLSRLIEAASFANPGTDVFILGNHGLVLGGDDVPHVEALLLEIERRLAIAPRSSLPADHPALAAVCTASRWTLPADDAVHSLATDANAPAILAGGLLYPCQAILSGSRTSSLFRSIPYDEYRQVEYGDRPFLLLKDRGLVFSRSAQPAEVAMISGLARIVQRLSPSAPIRYLTESEVAGLCGQVAYRYRELANVMCDRL